MAKDSQYRGNGAESTVNFVVRSSTRLTQSRRIEVSENGVARMLVPLRPDA